MSWGFGRTAPNVSKPISKKPLLIVYRKSTNYNCVNKNVEEIIENFESFRRDKSYIQNAIATVQGALKRRLKSKPSVTTLEVETPIDLEVSIFCMLVERLIDK